MDEKIEDKQPVGQCVQIVMPAEWKPGRCYVQFDATSSCPFGKNGCWVSKPERCPLFTKDPFKGQTL